MKMEKESNIYSAFENNTARVRMGRKGWKLDERGESRVQLSGRLGTVNGLGKHEVIFR